MLSGLVVSGSHPVLYCSGDIEDLRSEVPMRNNSIDSLRFIAIICVIIIHIPPYKDSFLGQMIKQTARFAVPYFFIIAGYLFYEKIKIDRENIKYPTKYGIRLLNVYLFWYAVYALWPLFAPENISDIVNNGFMHEFNSWGTKFYNDATDHLLYYIGVGGRGYHLWYLPSLGMAILILSISHRFRLFYTGLLFAFILFIIALLSEPYRDSFVGIHLSFSLQYSPFFSSIFVFIGALINKLNAKVSLKNAIGLTLFGVILQLSEMIFIGKKYDFALTEHAFVVGTLFLSTGIALIAISKKRHWHEI